ncbi:MAG: Flp family type IVb pilin [Rhodospirillales bacterium]|nr:Flp family type IVb pilin [Rhodospirillales bacterium]
MLNLIRRFSKDERGAAAIEYTLIAGLIALAIVVGATNLGTALGAKMQALADAVTTAGTP